MLALKFPNELNWGDLRYIEDPMHAMQTVEREHGKRINGQNIQNAHRHDLPSNSGTRFNAYGSIRNQLENGQVFLVNYATGAPAVESLQVNESGSPEYRLRTSVNDYFKNAFGSALQFVPVPKPTGVLRDEPKPSQAQQQQTKKEREKHVVLLDLEGQDGRPLPAKHNITLYIENTTQGTVAARQLSEVIYNPFSRVFSTEKGDQLKVYAIPDSLLEVRKDLNDNKSLAQSESKGLIAPLTETSQETRQDGATLHHVNYIVPNYLVEIKLYDEDGEPEAKENYQIKNLNGKILVSGKLDDEGYAFVDGLEHSEVQICFPNIK